MGDTVGPENSKKRTRDDQQVATALGRLIEFRIVVENSFVGNAFFGNGVEVIEVIAF